jgi:aminoglycoside 6'-N-acetyltransferase
MILRPASLGDLALLRYWDRKPHVIASTGRDDGLDWAAELSQQGPFSEYLIAEEAGSPIGVMQIIDPAREESHYWGEIEENLRAIDIWIGEEADLGRGLGTEMMHLALARCFADPAVTGVVIDPLESNRRAHRFYERLGFRLLGPRRIGEDNCLVYGLAHEDWACGPQTSSLPSAQSGRA